MLLYFNGTDPSFIYTLFRLSVRSHAVHLFFYVTLELRSFETSVTKRPTTQSRIPED